MPTGIMQYSIDNQTPRFTFRRLKLNTALAVILLLGFYPVAMAADVEIRLEGVEAELRTNILAYLSLAQSSSDLSINDIRSLHKQATEEIQKALQPFGYYRATVQSDLTQRKADWLANYRIDLGLPLKVTELALTLDGEGADSTEFTQLVNNFPVKQGQILRHVDYEQGKDALQQLSAELGYLDAAFRENQIRIDLENYTTSVILNYDTGPRYRFGAISFDQKDFQKEFKEKFLRQFLAIEPGDAYTTAALLEVQNAFRDSDYFQRVEVQPQRELAKNGIIPVVVTLEPKPSNKYSFGLGYGTDSGARGSIDVERRRLNSRGHRLDGELEISQISASLIGRYRIPIGDPRTDELSFNLGYEDETTDTSDSKRALIGTSRTVSRGAWRETLSLNFQNEDFEVAGEEGTSNLLIPGGAWSRIVADDRVYTRRGNRIQFDVRGAVKGILTDTSFLQTRAQGKYIRAVGEKGRVILRGDVGLTEVSDVTDLPASIRFFAGGDQSVRGYDFEELGPTNEEGEVIGGKHLLVGSAEYEQRFSDNWGAAVFFDAGNALNDFSDPLREGAGVGVRWRSPVGMVRVDVAAPLDESEDDVRLHINIGPDF